MEGAQLQAASEPGEGQFSRLVFCSLPSRATALAPSWYHSPEDTLDKVPAAALANMAAAQRALLDALIAAEGSELRAANPGHCATTITDGVFFTRPADVPRGRHSKTRAEIQSAQRERLLIAVTELLATRGYAGFGIREICKAASVSQSAFYANFDEKDSCVFSAYDRFIGVLKSRMTDAIVRADEAGEPVAAFVSSYILTLQSDLVTARAFQVEMDSLGSVARRRRRDALRSLGEALRARLPQPIGQDVMTAAIYAVRQTVSDALDENHSPDLSELIPQTTTWVSRLLSTDRA